MYISPWQPLSSSVDPVTVEDTINSISMIQYKYDTVSHDLTSHFSGRVWFTALFSDGQSTSVAWEIQSKIENLRPSLTKSGFDFLSSAAALNALFPSSVNLYPRLW